MDELTELKNRILDLENQKKKIEDIIPWRENELPKFQSEISAIRQTLHELRAEWESLKNAAKTETITGDPFHGFFTR